MKSRKKVLVVIPVFNEEEHIKEVIRNIKSNIDIQSTDILIINDGSDDKTSKHLEKAEDIIIITHLKNEGYGRSLIDGFEYGIRNQYGYIISMDCDRQHEPNKLKKFIKAIMEDDHDIISGSRYLDFDPDKEKEIPQDRLKINRRITKKINRLTGYSLTDSFCGFKAYKASSLKKLDLTEPGYGFPLQLWFEAGRKDLKIKEIPVEMIYLDYTRNFHNNFRSVYTRYKYYLKIIEREGKAYEYNDN